MEVANAVINLQIFTQFFCNKMQIEFPQSIFAKEYSIPIQYKEVHS